MSKIHFIGIGGIGMSALARIYLAHGNKISGTDSSSSVITQNLLKEGCMIYIGHSERYISENIDRVIYTEAISKDNPELIKAKNLNIPCLSYFEGISELTREHNAILIAGTHGKSTTTAMTALCLTKAGLDPTVVIGTNLKEFDNKNMRIGKSNYFIVEACEYRESFLALNPYILVITNCDLDHIDYYKNEENYTNAFIKLIRKIPKEGWLIMSKNTLEEKYTIFKKEAKCGVFNIDEHIKDIPDLKIPGDHNRENARCASSVSEILHIPAQITQKALKDFQGSWRRFEIIGKKNGVIYIDDYGHHPKEIRAALKAARETYSNNRIICVYQPHQFSRTKFFLKEFSEAFEDADIVIIPNIYEARDSDEDKIGINEEILCQEIRKHHNNVIYGEGLIKTVTKLKKLVKKDDIVITMGAGDVWKIAKKILDFRF